MTMIFNNIYLLLVSESNIFPLPVPPSYVAYVALWERIVHDKLQPSSVYQLCASFYCQPVPVFKDFWEANLLPLFWQGTVKMWQEMRMERWGLTCKKGSWGIKITRSAYWIFLYKSILKQYSHAHMHTERVTGLWNCSSCPYWLLQRHFKINSSVMRDFWNEIPCLSFNGKPFLAEASRRDSNTSRQHVSFTWAERPVHFVPHHFCWHIYREGSLCVDRRIDHSNQ